MLIVPERTESEWEEACRLAEQGDACAQSQLGLEYLYGPGFLGGHDEDAGQDWAEGERWLRKAAHQGFAKAQYHLGYLYDQGRGLPSNDAEAVRWYQKAADQGHYEAEISLENRRLRRMT